MSWRRVKGGLTTASIAIGVLLGATELWQRTKPSEELVAEVASIDARLPADFVLRVKGLPEAVRVAVVNPTGNAPRKKINPQTLSFLDGEVLVAMKRSIADMFQPYLTPKHIDVVTVSNPTSTPYGAVQLQPQFFPGGANVTIFYPDGRELTKHLEGGVIELGDLRPGSKVSVVVWDRFGLGLQLGDLRLTHSTGQGSVRYYPAVPEYVERGQGFGVPVPYRHLTTACALDLIT